MAVRAAWTAAVSAVALLAPRLALACAVCGANLDTRSQNAFVETTVFLSLLPISMFGGFAFWIWRRYKAQERALQAAEVSRASARPEQSSSSESRRAGLR